MRPIRLRILNKRVTISRTGQTIGSTGAAQGATVILYSNVPMRIVKAKGDDEVKEQGNKALSSHIGMIQPSIIIATVDTPIKIVPGNIVTDGDDRYKVDFVDDEPGGLIGHHQEVFMSILGKGKE